MENLKAKEARIKIRTKALPGRVTKPVDALYSIGVRHKNDILTMQDIIKVIIYINIAG
jgi:hypothetical protein